MKLKSISLIFAVCFLFQMVLCKKDDEIKIGTFKGLPPEVDGCACYFSKNEKEFRLRKYIWADNYFHNGYIIINDKKITFKNVTSGVSANGDDVHWTKTYKSKKYQIKIEMFQTGEIDETRQQKGTIMIKSNNGKQITETFYGECGC